MVYLPGSYQVNDATRATPSRGPTAPSTACPGTRFVFCHFNQAYKLDARRSSPVWMRMLRQTPGSVLWLLDRGRGLRTQPASGGGGPRGRSRPAGLRAYHPPCRAPGAACGWRDLFLDTLPYNAHTTASDALWAGLPLITCPGTRFPGRVAASLLHAVGLPELVATDIPAYEALAVSLAADPGPPRGLARPLGQGPRDRAPVRHRPHRPLDRERLSVDGRALAGRESAEGFAAVEVRTHSRTFPTHAPNFSM